MFTRHCTVTWLARNIYRNVFLNISTQVANHYRTRDFYVKSASRERRRDKNNSQRTCDFVVKYFRSISEFVSFSECLNAIATQMFCVWLSCVKSAGSNGRLSVCYRWKFIRRLESASKLKENVKWLKEMKVCKLCEGKKILENCENQLKIKYFWWKLLKQICWIVQTRETTIFKRLMEHNNFVDYFLQSSRLKVSKFNFFWVIYRRKKPVNKKQTNERRNETTTRIRKTRSTRDLKRSDTSCKMVKIDWELPSSRRCVFLN